MYKDIDIFAPGEATSEIASSSNELISVPYKLIVYQTEIQLTFFPNKMSATLDDGLLKLFYIDCMPFSMVEDKGFKDFVKLLNPAYILPRRQTFSKTSLPFTYEKCLNYMKTYYYGQGTH